MSESSMSSSFTAAGNRRCAGVYIHVPFCNSRCIYCDFYSTTGQEELKDAYTDAVIAEMVQRRTEVSGPVDTLYLGGGTPSVLSPKHVEKILDAVRRNFSVTDDAEITMEANPDDVTTDFCEFVTACGINRFSLGVQTFDDESLKYLHRRHNGQEAVNAVKALHDNGIENITIDLIYGLPGETLQDWKEDVSRALSLPITHLSAYSLMYEDGTMLTKLRDKGDVEETDDEESLRMYEHLLEATAAAGMEHYEISNFARTGFRSRHNSKYWQGIPYLGLGPGAHSFDGKSTRRRNLPLLRQYAAGIDGVPFEVEHLSETDRCNERIFTSLRTIDGLDMRRFASDFGKETAAEVKRCAERHLKNNLLLEDSGVLRLTRRGLFLSDMVMSDLMQ